MNINPISFGKVVKVNSGAIKVARVANGFRVAADEKFHNQVRTIFNDVPIKRCNASDFYRSRLTTKSGYMEIPQSLTIIPNEYQATIIQIDRQSYVVSGEERKQIEELKKEYEAKKQAFDDEFALKFVQTYHEYIGAGKNWEATKPIRDEKASELYREYEQKVKEYIQDKVEPYAIDVIDNMTEKPSLKISTANKEIN